MNSKTVVIGLGNPLRADDGAGPAVVRAVQKTALPVRCEIVQAVGLAVVEAMLGAERAYVVDACLTGREPGTLLRPGLNDLPDPGAATGSHCLDLGQMLRTGYELFPDSMPRDLRLILIEASDPNDYSEAMTPALTQAVADTAALIAKENQPGRKQTDPNG